MTEEERILRRIPLEILGLASFLALTSLLFFSTLTALFIVAGGAFSALNFIWLKRSTSRFFLPGQTDAAGKIKALRSSLALYGLRLLLILAVFFIIILLFSKKIIAFAVGFSVIIPVFLTEAAIALSRIKQWKS